MSRANKDCYFWWRGARGSRFVVGVNPRSALMRRRLGAAQSQISAAQCISTHSPRRRRPGGYMDAAAHAGVAALLLVARMPCLCACCLNAPLCCRTGGRVGCGAAHQQPPRDEHQGARIAPSPGRQRA